MKTAERGEKQMIMLERRLVLSVALAIKQNYEREARWVQDDWIIVVLKVLDLTVLEQIRLLMGLTAQPTGSVSWHQNHDVAAPRHS